MSGKQLIGATLGLSTLAFGFWAPLESLDPQAQRALGLVLFAVLFWTTEPIPLEFSSLVLLLILPATGLLSFQDSFSPFAGKTVWLIFAGMVLSLGITETGLGQHLAARSLPYLGRRPGPFLLNLHLIGLLAAFLIPSGVVRVLLLMPIGISMVDRLGGRDDPRLNAAILLSLLCSTYYGGCGILTGSVPNLVVAGQLERVAGRVIYWAEWIKWMFPIIGLLRTGLCFVVIWVLLGRKLQFRNLPSPAVPTSGGGLTSSQRRVLAILLLGVLLWATDVFHQIAPVYVALALVLLYALPGWGPLPFGNIRKINFTFLFYIAALFSLGAALEVSGFNGRLITLFTRLIDISHYNWLGQHLAITFITVPLDFLMDIAVVAGVITPTMLELGQAHQLDSLTVALSVGMATSHAFLPYQAAPFMLAYSYRRFSMGQLVVTMLCISLLSLFLLCPLNLLYWHWLGLL